ncbi:hypothetical protein HYH03_019026 [Edaphochlamys debaryana]|uniref:Uncharacterized protein n=1 Tax=Edaphochlamys debaryana TaxID=47281 RepID=A0A835XFV5_9CHLO|nr:hypothetical protein HYH03_019026 [Edaphochlamys debaryana]|eukprot:KAG2482018.1 hypothetical protein HYH03_019026 [Edaphochlamys debaryana]
MYLTGCGELLCDVAGGRDRVPSTPFRLAVLEDGRAVVEAGKVTEPEPRILPASAFQDGAFVAVPVELLLDLVGLSAEQLAGLKGRLQLRVRASVAGSPGAEDLEGVSLAPYSRSWVLRGLRPWLLRSGAAVGDLLALGRAEEPPPAPGADAGAGPSTAGAAADGGSVPAITVRLFRTGAGGPAAAVQQAAEALSPGQAAHDGGCTASRPRCGHADASQAAEASRRECAAGAGGSASHKRGREDPEAWGAAAGSGEEGEEQAPVACRTRRGSQAARGPIGPCLGSGQQTRKPDGNTAVRGGGRSDGGHTDRPSPGGQDASHAAAAAGPSASANPDDPVSVIGAGRDGPCTTMATAASIAHLQGYVPPGELPPVRPGELRLCGLTFHPAAAPAVRAALEQWEAAQSCAAAPAAGLFNLQAAAEAAGVPGMDRVVLRTSLEGLLGLKAPAGAAGRPLPEGPVACGLVAPCGDPAQGHSGLRATTRIAAGSAVCVVGGYVLPRGAAEELVASGLSHCRPEVRAQVPGSSLTSGTSSSGVAGTAAKAEAWRLMVCALLLPYKLVARHRGGEDGPSAGDTAALLRRLALLQPHAARLLDDPAADKGALAEGGSAPVRPPGPNCKILSVSVRGVCLPVLVALRDISRGAAAEGLREGLVE